jgi:hypothetical protein
MKDDASSSLGASRENAEMAAALQISSALLLCEGRNDKAARRGSGRQGRIGKEAEADNGQLAGKGW